MLNRSSGPSIDRAVVPMLGAGIRRACQAARADPRAGLPLLLIAMAASVFLVGFSWPYWRSADQDLILAYQGLLFNAGLPQEYFDHPGYLSYLVIGEWYRLLHTIGVLEVYSLATLPSSADAIAFNSAWQHLIAAGRLLSLLVGGLSVLTFATLVRYLVGDWRVAVLGAVGLGFSAGIVTHIRIMRTELLSSALTTTALLLVLIAGRLHRNWRLPALGLAGLCCALAIIGKIQALFPVMTIPAIALLFAEPVRVRSCAGEGNLREWGLSAGLMLLSAALAFPAAALLLTGVHSRTGSLIGYYPIGGGLAGVTRSQSCSGRF